MLARGIVRLVTEITERITMRLISVELEDDVYDFLAIRAAIDDLKLAEAVEQFLTILAKSLMEKKIKQSLNT